MIPRSSFYKKRCAIRQCRTYPAYVPPTSALPGSAAGYGADATRMRHNRGKTRHEPARHIKPLPYSRFPVYKDTK